MQDPLPFEELKVGDRFESWARTVTESDVVGFAGMTADFGAIHIDHETAANTPFRKPIAHGLLGLSWVAGFAHHCPYVRTEALLSIQDWKFLKPIFIGDTLHLVNEVIELEPKGRRRGRVLWKRQLVNQSGEVVQVGTFECLVSTSRGAPKAPHFDAAKKGAAADGGETRATAESDAGGD
jgi:acyl dehydratase